MTVKAETSREFPITMTLTRRGFVKIGGALFVSLYLPGQGSATRAAKNETSLDPSQLASWLEIRDDNTNVRPETISLLMGDTDKTPDGGYSAGFLTGMSNVRKVSAYTYQALLGLAATQLGVPVSGLSVVDGIVSGEGRSISYGQLVQGQHLDLKIPVTGQPAKSDPAGWVGITPSSA